MSLNAATIQDLHRRCAVLEDEQKSAAENLKKAGEELGAINVLLALANGSRGVSTADRIRLALQGLERAASPKEVAVRMISDGLEWSRKSDMNSYVGAELHRMSKAKRSPVKSVKRGSYIYAAGE